MATVEKSASKPSKSKVVRHGIKFLAAASNQEFAVGPLPESVDDRGLVERFAGLIGAAGELRAAGQSWIDHRSQRPDVGAMVRHGIRSREMQIALLRQEADARAMADDVMMEVHRDLCETRDGLQLAARNKRQELLDELAAQGYTDTTAFRSATLNRAGVRQLRSDGDFAREAARDFVTRASHHRGNAQWCREKAESLYREIVNGESLAAAVYREPTGNPGEYDDRQAREERRTSSLRKGQP